MTNPAFPRALRAAFWLLAVPAVFAARTNFIVIMADDLGYGDVSAYGATAFRTLDLTTRALADAALPGTGEISIVGNAVNEVNDYIYGSNTDPGRQNRADTLYVFDGVTASSFRLDLPPEVATFANVTPFAPMGILYAQATARAVGDEALAHLPGNP